MIYDVVKSGNFTLHAPRSHNTSAESISHVRLSLSEIYERPVPCSFVLQEKNPKKPSNFDALFQLLFCFASVKKKKINQAKKQNKPDQDGQIKSIILLFFVVFLLFSSFGGLLQCGASFLNLILFRRS